MKNNVIDKRDEGTKSQNRYKEKEKERERENKHETTKFISRAAYLFEFVSILFSIPGARI